MTEPTPDPATPDAATPDAATMRVAAHRVYGSGEVLRLDRRPVPEPGPGEVRVRIAAAGVSMGDWHLMTGLPSVARLAFGRRAPRQPVRGMEAAGVVDAVGPEVTRFAVGDAVFGWIGASYAEAAVVRESLVAAVPAPLALEEAAALTFGGSTAIHALRAARVAAGSKVLVIGAGGGVGALATQLAVADGARVTGVCSAAKASLVTELGAAEVVDYRVDDLARFAGRFDAVLDIAGARPLGLLESLVRRGGTVALVGAEGGGRRLGQLGRNLRAAARSPLSPARFVTVAAPNRGEDVAELARRAAAGELRVPVTARYALADAGRALDDLAAGRIAGKAVIVPGLD